MTTVGADTARIVVSTPDRLALWGVVQRQDSGFWSQLSRFESGPPSCRSFVVPFESVRPQCEHVFVPRDTESQLREVVARASTLKEVLVHFGLRPAGGNFRLLRHWLSAWDISTDHFTGTPAPRARDAIPLAEVLVEHSTYQRFQLKQRLYAAGLKRRECELCGQGEEWNGRHMSLIRRGAQVGARV
jgi:hypothetical protein